MTNQKFNKAVWLALFFFMGVGFVSFLGTLSTWPPYETEKYETVLMGRDFVETPLFEKYCNQRFSFCLEYPSSIFDITRKPANADGIILVNADSTLFIKASAIYNVLNEKVEDLIESAKKPDEPKNSETVKIEKQPGAFILKGKTVNGWFYEEKVVVSKRKIGRCLVKYDGSKILPEEIPIKEILNSFHFIPEPQ